MDIGSIFDIYLTGENVFNHMYRIEEQVNFSDKVIEIGDAIIEAIGNELRVDDISQDFLLTLSEQCAYRMNVKNPEKRIEWLAREVDPYLDHAEKLSKDPRRPVSPEMVDAARQMSVNVREFLPNLFKEYIVTNYQVPLYGELYGMQCKGLADMILYNMEDVPYKIHDEWEIPPKHYQLVEFKGTKAPAYTYLYGGAKRGRHDIQISFYHELMKSKGWKCTAPVTIVESWGDPGRPVYHVWSERDMDFGQWGGEMENGKLEPMLGNFDYATTNVLNGWQQGLDAVKILSEKGSAERPLNSMNGRLYGNMYR